MLFYCFQYYLFDVFFAYRRIIFSNLCADFKSNTALAILLSMQSRHIFFFHFYYFCVCMRACNSLYVIIYRFFFYQVFQDHWSTFILPISLVQLPNCSLLSYCLVSFLFIDYSCSQNNPSVIFINSRFFNSINI